MVDIPSDLRKNKETIIGNMDLREFICLILGLMFAIFVLYYIRAVLGYKKIIIASFIAGIFVMPFLIFGFKKINGMKIDDYFKIFVNNKILASSKRIDINRSLEIKISNKKYEIVRVYRLFKNDEIFNLRKNLIDKKILILTEYIDYRDIHIVIFRIDGKNMILDNIKRNKKDILDKKIEIKNFINNEIKKLKKEKCKSLERKEKNEFKNNKKNELKKLNDKLKILKSHIKYLQNKTFDDIKNEIDIFENLENIKPERIFINYKDKKKNDKSHNEIYYLKEEINSDERKVYELHLFNKSNFKKFIKGINDKIIFINANDYVDVFFYEIVNINKNIGEENIDNYSNNNEPLVDTIELDKNDILCKNTLSNFEARNYYNNYRKINNLMEII